MIQFGQAEPLPELGAHPFVHHLLERLVGADRATVHEQPLSRHAGLGQQRLDPQRRGHPGAAHQSEPKRKPNDQTKLHAHAQGSTLGALRTILPRPELQSMWERSQARASDKVLGRLRASGFGLQEDASFLAPEAWSLKPEAQPCEAATQSPSEPR